MTQLRTQETELYDTALAVLTKARERDVGEIRSAQDAMLNLRIDWESLETCLRNRKIDGFEPAVESMKALAATTIAMAATLQAKILNQRIRQMENDAVNAVDDFAAERLKLKLRNQKSGIGKRKVK